MNKLLIERVFEHAVWKIDRWASEADKKAGKIYSREEALKLFGVPQFTTIKGNCLLNEGIMNSGQFFVLQAERNLIMPTPRQE